MTCGEHTNFNLWPCLHSNNKKQKYIAPIAQQKDTDLENAEICMYRKIVWNLAHKGSLPAKKKKAFFPPKIM